MLTRINRWAIAGAIGLAGLFSVVAAESSPRQDHRLGGHNRHHDPAATGVDAVGEFVLDSSTSVEFRATARLERRRLGRLVTAFWYLTRGTGIVALILLTLSLSLGIANVLRMRVPGAPRFVTLGIHRTISLLAVAFVAVHVLTTVADGYVPVGIASAVIPFSAGYRPFWVGLGAIAFDLLLALVITSLLRRRVGYRTWRLVHWAAYACWPIAFVHALGTGTDPGTGWMTAILASLAGLVGAAVLGRVSARRARAPVTQGA